MLFAVDIPVDTPKMNFTYGITVGTGGVRAASNSVSLSSLPKSCGME